MSWEIAIAFVMVGTAFALLFISTTLNREHDLIKVFLMFIAMFVLVSTLGLNEHIINANADVINNETKSNLLLSQTGNIYGSFLTVTIVSLTYFMGYLGYRLISAKRARRKERA